MMAVGDRAQNLEAFAYRSVAVDGLGPTDLDALLVSARDFNASVGVTGALFHHEGLFFQYIEGPASALSQVYERITRSRLHDQIVGLAREPVEQRQFEAWYMAFCEPPASVLQELSTTLWEDSMPITRDTVVPARHLGMILDYWNRWSAQQDADRPLGS